MTAIYGSAWTSRLTNERSHFVAACEWGRQLNGLTEDQIAIGIGNLTGSFPPTPADFKALCLGYENSEDMSKNGNQIKYEVL